MAGDDLAMLAEWSAANPTRRRMAIFAVVTGLYALPPLVIGVAYDAIPGPPALFAGWLANILIPAFSAIFFWIRRSSLDQQWGE